jgi:hypothetical protein
VDLPLLKKFVEVLNLPKGALVRQLSDDVEWSIVRSPQKLHVFSVSCLELLLTGCLQKQVG